MKQTKYSYNDIKGRWGIVKKTNFLNDINLSPEEKIIVSNRHKTISEKTLLKLSPVFWKEVMKIVRMFSKNSIKDKWYYMLLPVANSNRDMNDPSKARRFPLTSLPSKGCYHILKNGGCTMCDYGNNPKSTPEFLLDQAKEFIDFLIADNEDYDVAIFCIAALGSFFDDNEIYPETREYIYRRIAEYSKQHPDKLTSISIESRLECITEKKLQDMRAVLGDDVEIEIGYGVESASKLISECIINKKYTETNQNKIDLMVKYDVKVVSHILVKPQFLTPREATIDAISSLKSTLSDKSITFTIAMAMAVRQGTMTGELFNNDLYQIPSIWMLVKIMEELKAELAYRTRFFGLVISETDSPNIKKQINVTKVSAATSDEKVVLDLLMNYTGYEDERRDILEFSRSSPEYNAWIKGVYSRKTETPLKDRICAFMDIISQVYLDQTIFEYIENHPLI